MLRGANGWLLSRGVAVLALGFLVSLIGALGSAFYLDPAQRSAGAATQQIALEASQAQMLRAATAYDDIAGHLGALLFTVSLPPDVSDEQRAAIGALRRRAMDHRHDGVRAYLAALGVAGAIDYPVESSRYESLVAAEKANFNIDTYRAANAFEGDLAQAMVKAQGDAAMKAITLETERREAKRIASERGLRLLAVTMLGSTLVFLATIAGAGPKPSTPLAIGAPRLLAIALMRLKSPERRVTATQYRRESLASPGFSQTFVLVGEAIRDPHRLRADRAWDAGS